MRAKKSSEGKASPKTGNGKKRAYDALIQTLVPTDVSLRVKELATREGMSLAAYVRRLILRDVEVMEAIHGRSKRSAGANP